MTSIKAAAESSLVKSGLRWPLAGAAIVAAIAHVPVIGPHLDEAPYMGVLFILLTTACVVLATAAILYDSAAVYAASAVVCGTAIIGYAATRLVAFPLLADDVGNWLEPLGVLSIASEAVVVFVALRALRTTSRTAIGGRVGGDRAGPRSGVTHATSPTPNRSPGAHRSRHRRSHPVLRNDRETSARSRPERDHRPSDRRRTR